MNNKRIPLFYKMKSQGLGQEGGGGLGELKGSKKAHEKAQDIPQVWTREPHRTQPHEPGPHTTRPYWLKHALDIPIFRNLQGSLALLGARELNKNKGNTYNQISA